MALLPRHSRLPMHVIAVNTAKWISIIKLLTRLLQNHSQFCMIYFFSFLIEQFKCVYAYMARYNIFSPVQGSVETTSVHYKFNPHFFTSSRKFESNTYLTCIPVTSLQLVVMWQFCSILFFFFSQILHVQSAIAKTYTYSLFVELKLG